MALSAKEAATLVGMSKQGIIRAIHKGKLSATRNDHGEFVIDPAELFRVYEPLPAAVPDATPVADNDTAHQIKSLQEKVAMLERMIDDKDFLIQSLLDKIPVAPQPLQLEDKQHPKQWWQRIFQRG